MSDDFDFIIVQTKHTDCGDCTFTYNSGSGWDVSADRCYAPIGSTVPCECIPPADGNFPANPQDGDTHIEDCYYAECARCTWFWDESPGAGGVWSILYDCARVPGCSWCSEGNRPPDPAPDAPRDASGFITYTAPCQPEGHCCRAPNDGGPCEWSLFDDEHSGDCSGPGTLGGEYGCITVVCGDYIDENTLCSVIKDCVRESNAACQEQCDECVETDTGLCLACRDDGVAGDGEIHCIPIIALECNGPNENCDESACSECDSFLGLICGCEEWIWSCDEEGSIEGADCGDALTGAWYLGSDFACAGGCSPAGMPEFNGTSEGQSEITCCIPD